MQRQGAKGRLSSLFGGKAEHTVGLEIIHNYAIHGHGKEALSLLKEIQYDRVELDEVSVLRALVAAMLGWLKMRFSYTSRWRTSLKNQASTPPPYCGCGSSWKGWQAGRSGTVLEAAGGKSRYCNIGDVYWVHGDLSRGQWV